MWPAVARSAGDAGAERIAAATPDASAGRDAPRAGADRRDSAVDTEVGLYARRAPYVHGMSEAPTTPWTRVGDEDGTAAVIGAVLELDPDGTYTEKELAAAADVSYRDLFLGEAVETVIDLGLLDRVGDSDADADAAEDRFAVATESPAYGAARAFAAAAGRCGARDPVESREDGGSDGDVDVDLPGRPGRRA